MESLRYSRQEYENKFERIEVHNRQLAERLEYLDYYRHQLLHYWDDDISRGYFAVLGMEIAKLREAMDNIERLGEQYRKIIDEMEAQKNQGEALMDEINGMLRGIRFDG